MDLAFNTAENLSRVSSQDTSDSAVLNEAISNALVHKAAQKLIDVHKNGVSVQVEAFDIPHDALISVSSQLEQLGISQYVSKPLVDALKDYVLSKGGSFARAVNAKPIYIAAEVLDRRPDFRFEEGITDIAAIDSTSLVAEGIADVELQTTITGTKMTSNRANIDKMFASVKDYKLWIRFESPSKDEIDGLMNQQQIGFTAIGQALGGGVSAAELENIIDEAKATGSPLSEETLELLDHISHMRLLMEAPRTTEIAQSMKFATEQLMHMLNANSLHQNVPAQIIDGAFASLQVIEQSYGGALETVSPASVTTDIDGDIPSQEALASTTLDIPEYAAEDIITLIQNLNSPDIKDAIPTELQNAINALEQSGLDVETVQAEQAAQIIKGEADPAASEALQNIIIALNAPEIQSALPQTQLNMVNTVLKDHPKLVDTVSASVALSGLTSALENGKLFPNQVNALKETIAKLQSGQTIDSIDQAMLITLVESFPPGASSSAEHAINVIRSAQSDNVVLNSETLAQIETLTHDLEAIQDVLNSEIGPSDQNSAGDIKVQQQELKEQISRSIEALKSDPGNIEALAALSTLNDSLLSGEHAIALPPSVQNAIEHIDTSAIAESISAQQTAIAIQKNIDTETLSNTVTLVQTLESVPADSPAFENIDVAQAIRALKDDPSSLQSAVALEQVNTVLNAPEAPAELVNALSQQIETLQSLQSSAVQETTGLSASDTQKTIETLAALADPETSAVFSTETTTNIEAVIENISRGDLSAETLQDLSSAQAIIEKTSPELAQQIQEVVSAQIETTSPSEAALVETTLNLVETIQTSQNTSIESVSETLAQETDSVAIDISSESSEPAIMPPTDNVDVELGTVFSEVSKDNRIITEKNLEQTSDKGADIIDLNNYKETALNNNDAESPSNSGDQHIDSSINSISREFDTAASRSSNTLEVVQLDAALISPEDGITNFGSQQNDDLSSKTELGGSNDDYTPPETQAAQEDAAPEIKSCGHTGPCNCGDKAVQSTEADSTAELFGSSDDYTPAETHAPQEDVAPEMKSCGHAGPCNCGEKATQSTEADSTAELFGSNDDYTPAETHAPQEEVAPEMKSCGHTGPCNCGEKATQSTEANSTADLFGSNDDYTPAETHAPQEDVAPEMKSCGHTGPCNCGDKAVQSTEANSEADLFGSKDDYTPAETHMPQEDVAPDVKSCGHIGPCNCGEKAVQSEQAEDTADLFGDSSFDETDPSEQKSRHKIKELRHGL